MLEPFTLPFVQRGMLEIVVLAAAAGLVGTWIVLRGLAFYAHAVGTAAFPGLVLADGLSFAPALGALGAAVLFALAMGALSARRRPGYDTLTALVLVGALSGGILLASDVFRSGGNVETLLFGSLLLVDGTDVAIAAAVSALALGANVALGRRWVATGFDEDAARQSGLATARLDLALLLLVALAAVASLSAVGALLATALLVVPAATTRLWPLPLARWQMATVALVAAEGVGGMWLSAQTNAPPGATIAVLSGAVFAVALLLRGLAQRQTARRAVASAAVLASLGFAACGGANGTGGGETSVVATTTQLADIVRAVAGPDADVVGVLPPNTDAHDFEPRPADVRDTGGAQVVFTNGQNLDRWMGDVVEQSGGDPAVVDLGERLVERVPGETEGEEASRYDPHLWHDPANVQAAVLVIRDALVKADPDGRTGYERRAAAYLAKVRTLDRGIARCMNAVAPGERKLVTDHDAFGYFAKRYGIEVVGAVIPSQTTQAQPSAGELAGLRKVIEREGVKAVFPEESVNARTAQAIARETGATSRYTLYGDSLGPKGSRGDTYLEMEAANADAMVRGFTGGARGCEIASP